MKRLALLTFLCATACAQLRTGSIKTEGPCSPVITGSGNTINIKTCGMTKEQIGKFRNILQLILSKQVDPAVLMSMLEDLKNRLTDVKTQLADIQTGINPNAAKVSYEFNGIEHIVVGGRFSAKAGDEFAAYQRMREMEKIANWTELLELSLQWMKRTPGWLGSYAFAGESYARLGNVSEAIKLLDRVAKQTSEDHDYDGVRKLLNQIRNGSH